jgi:hypothetical protein
MQTLLNYRYEATDDTGQTIKGTEKAASAASAHLALIQRGLRPTDLKEHKSVLQFEITRKTVKRKEIMHFSRQLSVFVEAGIPIMEALEVIGEETSDKLLKRVIVDMIVQLREGETFAAAAGAHPEAFPRYYVAVLESAELTAGGGRSLATHVCSDLSRGGRRAGPGHGDRLGNVRPAEIQDVLRVPEREAAASDSDAAEYLQFRE